MPSFRRLWSAGLISDGGDWLLFIALPLVVLQLSGSALGTSLAFLLELAPAVVLAPLVARVVARFDHRRLMVAVNIGQGISLVPLLFVHTRADLPLAYGVIVLQAVFSTAFEPAKNALLPRLVGDERIVSANSLVGVNQDLGRLIGGPLGGVLLVAGGLQLVVIADLVSYAASAVLVASLAWAAGGAGRLRASSPGLSAKPRGADTPPGAAVPQTSAQPAAATSNGLWALMTDRRMRGPLTLMAVAAVPQGLFVVLFVLFVTGPLHGSDADVGLLRGVQAIGAIAVGAALGFVASEVDVRRLTIVAVAVFAVVTLVVWNLPFVTRGIGFYVALFIVLGAPAVAISAGMTSILQKISTDAERGGVFTALGVVTALGQAVGMLGAGLLAGPVDVVPLLEVQGGLYCLAAALAFVLLPRFPARATPAAAALAGR